MLERIELVAPTSASTLFQGETGTGKGLCARALHERSGRRGAFVAVNCAALPENLSESELFGHLRGSFTGAVGNKRGLIEAADGGTLFLDEVTELTLHIQAKLLDVLDYGEYRPLGATALRRSDFRVIAATNADIDARVRGGAFRQDLLARFDCVRILLPPLRDHPDDIPALALHMLHLFGNGNGHCPTGLTPAALRYLIEQPWPTNVRGLRHAIHRAAALAGAVTTLDVGHFIESLPRVPTPDPAPAAAAEPLFASMRLVIASKLKFALEVTNGDGEAARRLGIGRATLYRYLKKLAPELSKLGWTRTRKRRNRKE